MADNVWFGTLADQQRQAGDTGADGKIAGALRTVTDNLADELVAHDGVPPGIPDEPGRRVRVIHVVHVRCTDRGAQRPQQQLARPWYRIGRVADL